MRKLPIIIVSIVLFAGCSNFSSTSDFVEVHFSPADNNLVKESVFNINLEYELIVPDSSVSYNVLWTGYDLQNKFGPIIPQELRLFTYLTSYSKTVNDFYYLYLPKSIIDSSSQWLKDYENSKERDLNNYHFVSDENVLDGKYLLYAQKNNVNDYLVYRGSNLLEVPYCIDDYQLVICLQAKTLTIKENVSTGNKINKSVIAFRRFELFYDETTNKLEQYSFENRESFNVRSVEQIFDYQGDRIEAYPSSFESMSFCYCPIMGLTGSELEKTVRADIFNGNIILPRYIVSNNESIDLLDSNSDLFFEEDVYRDFKSLFLGAYIKDYDYDDGHYKYGLFNYKKVEKIIKEVGSSRWWIILFFLFYFFSSL